MSTIYRRGEGESYYYSPKEVEPPKKELQHLEGLRSYLSEDQYEATLQQIRSQMDNGEPVENSIDRLAKITARQEFLAPRFRESRGAQVEMTIALLNEDPEPLTDADEDSYTSALDKHITEIKKASGESWGRLRTWCDEPALGAGKRKTGAVRVPTKVLRAIDEKVEEASANAPGRRAKKV